MGKETRIKKKKAKRRSALDWARVAAVLIGLVAIFVTIFLDEPIIISLELNQISKVELENSYFRTENGIVINNFRDTIIFPDDKLTFKTTLINKSEKTIDYTPIIRILQGEVIVKGPIQLENRTLIPYEGWTFYQKEFFVGGEGAKRLAELTEMDVDVCEDKIRDFLHIGSTLRHEDNSPVFAVRLHQFISKGDSVYATFESLNKRHLTLIGQRYIEAENDNDRVLAPLVFCRVCGQEYYKVTQKEADKILEPKITEDRDQEQASDGYLVIENEEEPIWDDSRLLELPNNWFRESKSGPRLKTEYRKICT